MPENERPTTDSSLVSRWTKNAILKETRRRGLGVFARRDFARGDLVVATDSGTVLDHQTEHSVQVDWNRHLEADSLIRFVNHSCEPNAGVRTNRYGFPDLLAFTDIAAGDEITFDYAMTEYRHYERADLELEFSLTCHCGSSTCRGRLGYYSELSATLKREYEGFVSEYLERPRPRINPSSQRDS